MGKTELDLSTVHPTAIVHPTVTIGKRTQIWAYVQIAEHAVVGKDCVIGNGAYIDRHVQIGNRVRIHNKALLYHGLIVEDDVFIGPGACFTNDQFPRSGKIRDLKRASWKIRKGASIGANATILPDINIGEYALVGAGSVVTKDIPSHVSVFGNPATPRAFVCFCGATENHRPLEVKKTFRFQCKNCQKTVIVNYSK